MSCGKHHETPCVDVLDQVWIYLDGEAEERDCASIRQHLDECSPCLRKYGIEQEVKTLVHRSCGSDDAPTDLKDRVRARIIEVRLEMTVEQRTD
jgi:mycothiol system anti-sigma-R factor